MIDLRSDTVTKPSKEMLQKVLEAELGDDEYKEDPTVNSLEEYCSELMGFESGLFVTSGLMGNQISLLIHSNPGEEVITTKDLHIKNMSMVQRPSCLERNLETLRALVEFMTWTASQKQ